MSDLEGSKLWRTMTLAGNGEDAAMRGWQDERTTVQGHGSHRNKDSRRAWKGMMGDERGGRRMRWKTNAQRQTIVVGRDSDGRWLSWAVVAMGDDRDGARARWLQHETIAGRDDSRARQRQGETATTREGSRARRQQREMIEGKSRGEKQRNKGFRRTEEKVYNLGPFKKSPPVLISKHRITPLFPTLALLLAGISRDRDRGLCEEGGRGVAGGLGFWDFLKEAETESRVVEDAEAEFKPGAELEGED
ncbi:hypothetical protein BOTBODRAFT_47455 [Botryobasidium botryosum FD-172 SS1]|uniref:Uncharacterized protein n=1 Tax=Botryobasidium botryosum (strain FD-172 SS1) TaxID=930990 RepID=A0A067M1U0_BOTB1|nr:hypothetical protein BOTBODRAFT_47455 [Botryobasidium botryosum FD-172 SS1]